MMKDKIDAFVCALKARGCSSRTIETYRWRLTQLREATGKPTLAISAEDLDQYIVDLWARNLSPVTVATRIQSIKTYFKWCVERSYLDRSPAMHLKKPKLERLCSDAMEEENLQLLLASAEKWAEAGKPRDLAMILFIADTGCRSGELCPLKIQDVNLEKREPWVEGKTGGRWVDFIERTARAIWDWLEVRPEIDCPYLFPSRRGGQLTTSGVWQMFRRHALRARIKGRCIPHAIRHLVGQAWLDNGANLELVKEKLGHKDIRTTSLFYSHQDRERVKSATERFSLVNGPE